MPAHRFVFRTWLIGVICLVGFWVFSLFGYHEAFWLTSDHTKNTRTEVNLSFGTLTLGHDSRSPFQGSGLNCYSISYKDFPAEDFDPFEIDPAPRTFAFYWGEFGMQAGGRRCYVSIPIWTLLVVFTAIAASCYIRSRARQRTADHAEVEKTSQRSC